MKDIADEAEILGKPGGGRLSVRFKGPFEGREVTWQATLHTISDWRQCHPQDDTEQSFIDIADDNGESISMTIVLGVPSIDLPTIRKSMMMVRQYKRLSRGRHYYGPRIS